MKISPVKALQWAGAAIGIALMVGLNFDYESEAGMRMNAPVEDPLSQGLLGYWKMDEGTGTSTTADSSGNANTLSLTGPPTWTTGNIGPYALDFSGTAQYLSVADPASGILDFANGASFSLTGWFNRDLFAADHTIIAKKNDQSTSSEAGYIVWVDNGTPDTLCLAVYGTAGYTVCSTSDLGSSGWHHFAISWNDAATTNPVKIYIDGADNTGTPTGTFSSVASLANARAFTIGAESDATAGTLFDGKLDDIRVYGFPLSVGDVLKLYQTTAPAQPVDTGLVGHWTFDGPDIKGTTAIDRSGKGNNGTITGAVPAIGKLGQGMSFNGTSDEISTANVVSLNNVYPVTYSFWLYPVTATGGDYGGILGKSYSQWIIDRQDSNNSIEFYRYCTGGSLDALSPANSFVLNQWQHIVITWDGVCTSLSGVKIYVNGVSQLVSGSTTTGTPNDDTNPLYIGTNIIAGNVHYKGSLDDVRIYNRALSATEVLNLYNLGR